MTTESDPELSRLFSKACEPLADDEFMAKLLMKIDGAQRARLRRRIWAAVLAVVVVLLNARLVLDTTAAAVRLAGEFTPSSTNLVISPWGWGVSMLIGAGALLLTRPSRR